MIANGRRAARLEHQLTSPNASLDDLDSAVALATEHGLDGLVVSPWLIKAARRALGRSTVRIGTVVAYPHGGQLLAVKAFEASKALEQGASGVDFPLNAGALISGEDDVVYNDLLAVIDMAHSALATAGVIVEVETLPDGLIRKACRLAERAGADHVVTSAGRATARVTIARAGLARDSLGPRVQVKAAGRFKTAAEVNEAIEAGATRIAASFTAQLLDQLAAQPELAAARR